MMIVGNWKAYVETVAAAKKLAAAGKRLTASGVEIVLAPSAPHLGILAQGNRSKTRFASQDITAISAGAATGELPAPALADLGVSYAIIGHSERRAMGETDSLIAKKAQHALANGIVPILCVGEKERDASGQYLIELRSQLATVFSALSHKEKLDVVVAYEPVWAIGKSSLDAITPPDLTEMALYIRKVLADYLSGKAADRARILYGGSVDSSNARDLAGGSGIDGFLVGRASTDAAVFASLVKAVS